MHLQVVVVNFKGLYKYIVTLVLKTYLQFIHSIDKDLHNLFNYKYK